MPDLAGLRIVSPLRRIRACKLQTSSVYSDDTTILNLRPIVDIFAGFLIFTMHKSKQRQELRELIEVVATNRCFLLLAFA